LLARLEPIKVEPFAGFHNIGLADSLARKYDTRVEVISSEIHSSSFAGKARAYQSGGLCGIPHRG